VSIAVWTAEELAERLAKGEPVNLIDVRERDEWLAGHIAEARLIPLSEFLDRIDELEPEREGPLVFICKAGVRSARVCEYLAQFGYDVVNVEGGMAAWPGEVVAGD
jgi:rhodanese-related sulfurtransferase